MAEIAVFLVGRVNSATSPKRKKLRSSAASIHCGHQVAEASTFHQSGGRHGRGWKHKGDRGFRGLQSSNGFAGINLRVKNKLGYNEVGRHGSEARNSPADNRAGWDRPETHALLKDRSDLFLRSVSNLRGTHRILSLQPAQPSLSSLPVDQESPGNWSVRYCARQKRKLSVRRTGQRAFCFRFQSFLAMKRSRALPTIEPTM
ncbi:MAG: hypothetical protein QOF14_3733 [Hyphomicrobiales bacterium]|nr:hypothetical protein [Hyphomicrobiales bacterium]